VIYTKGNKKIRENFNSRDLLPFKCGCKGSMVLFGEVFRRSVKSLKAAWCDKA
jgi:hypothetical protein